MESPVHLDVKKDQGLTVHWPDGAVSRYTIAHLRRMSPSADMRQLREQMRSNPLTVLPSSATRSAGPLVITSAELVGNYAISFEFSDGHSSGIYSWEYLRQIDPGAAQDHPPAAP